MTDRIEINVVNGDLACGIKNIKLSVPAEIEPAVEIDLGMSIEDFSDAVDNGDIVLTVDGERYYDVYSLIYDN